jgi:redox-sensitive bicupin YhaK (pirin superfamily)
VTGSSAIDVRRGGARPRTVTDWLDSRHSFSFGPHYDPANTSYGLLLAHNEDRIEPGGGYGAHVHRDLEVVTWVLEGALVHRDSAGHEGVLRPGVVSRMSAGAGIEHSETNDAPAAGAGGPVHFVQAWVRPDEVGGPPVLARQDVAPALAAGGLVPVVSGRQEHSGVVRLRNRCAALHAGRLVPGEAVALPVAPFVHLFLARGAAALEDARRLDAGDAVRLTAAGGHRLTALTDAEVLVWEMHAGTSASD